MALHELASPFNITVNTDIGTSRKTKGGGVAVVVGHGTVDAFWNDLKRQMPVRKRLRVEFKERITVPFRRIRGALLYWAHEFMGRLSVRLDFRARRGS